jgi:hypothetical protein
MLHFIFLPTKYQIRPLPTYPAELRELEIGLQVPHSHKGRVSIACEVRQ